MTRAYTKGAKLKAKRAAMPELAPVPTKQPNGRTRRPVDDRDKATENLKARCRQMGLKPTRENMREVRAQWYGCTAGRVIVAAASGETARKALWDAICEMRRIVVAYDRSIGAPDRHPACLRLLMPAEELSATAETPPLDMRSDEDKARQAQTRWMQMHGWLAYADPAARSVALSVVLDDQRCPDPAGLVQALACVSDGMTGKRLVYRGRDKAALA